MNKTLVSVLAILATASAFAASTPFPDSDESHDISSATAWGGTLPSSSTAISFEQTYSASLNANTKDVSFGQINVKKSITIDLSSTPERVIGGTYLDFFATWLKCNFIGGTWNLSKHLRTNDKTNLDLVFSDTTISCQKFQVTGSKNSLTFSDGAKLKTTTAANDTIQITGENTVTFSDGSAFESDAKSFTLAEKDISLTVIGSTVSLAPALGFDSASSNDRVKVLDKGSFSVASVSMNGTGNELCISNSALTCTGGNVVIEGSGNRVAVAGEDFTVSLSTKPDCVFKSGSQNEFVVSDGATWSNSAGIYHLAKPNTSASSNRVVVTRNGKLNLEKQLYVGSSNVWGNCMSVVDGGSVTAQSISVGGIGSSVAITNGTVSMTGSFYVGRSNNEYAEANANALVEVVGANTTVTSGNVNVYNGSMLRFVVPEAGYAKTPWVVDGKVVLRAGCAISVDADAYQATLSETSNVVLMTWTTGGTETKFDADALNKVNAELEPKKMKLIFDKDNKQFVLRVRSLKPGLTIILR